MPSNIKSRLPSWVSEPTPDIYLSDDYLVVDFETTNLQNGLAIEKRNSIVCGTWKFRGKIKTIVGNEYQFQELLEDIGKAKFLIAHNAKFELQWLQRCGLDLTKIIIYDTQIGEYVILGNRSAALDLDSVADRYGVGHKVHLVSKLVKSGVCPSEIPTNWLTMYNVADVELTEQVFLKQRKILKELGLLPTMYTRCLLTPVLADIEQFGMVIDGDRVKKVYEKLSEEYKEVMRDLDELTGGINPRSGTQVAEFLYITLGFKELRDRRGRPLRTGTGRPLTDSDTILQLEATTDEQRRFLELKKRQSYLDSKLTKTVQKFFDCLSDPDAPGILHASLNQTRTQTHRLSSTGLKYKAQFQNFDREFKPLFKARFPGWKVGEIDQAQLEFRTAVFCGQDERGFKDIEEHFDVHKYTASVLFNIPLELVTADQRQDAKPLTFKPLYGGEYGTDAEMAYFKAFREKYPGIARTQEDWTYQVLYTGKLVTCTGLIFYWPGTKMNFRGQIENKRAIYNYPIQSLATADIVPIGVVCLWHRMKSSGMQSFMINTIHDSAIAEIAPGEEQQYEELGKQAFIDDTYQYLKKCYGIDFNVPLEVETVISENWKDKKSWQEKWLM